MLSSSSDTVVPNRISALWPLNVVPSYNPLTKRTWSSINCETSNDASASNCCGLAGCCTSLAKFECSGGAADTTCTIQVRPIITSAKEVRLFLCWFVVSRITHELLNRWLQDGSQLRTDLLNIWCRSRIFFFPHSPYCTMIGLGFSLLFCRGAWWWSGLFEVQGYRVWYWIRLDLIEGDCWVLAERYAHYLVIL